MQGSIIFILGPTSSGKTKVAVELAKRINGEVVSCDSMQVYRDMDIITQAAGTYSQDVVSHLTKIISPEQEFNAAEFVKIVMDVINSVISKNKVPIFAGGTGLYVKALLDGIFPSPPKDEGLRHALQGIASEKGNEYLYSQLKEVDLATASGLHFNDVRRIVRALEVYKLTGRTINEKKMESEGIYQKYSCKMFGLSVPRGLLYKRIENTVERMFEQGLVEEVKQLRERSLSLTAGKALGIKEVSAFLSGDISLDKAKEELKRNTRKYAKRQLTWFRADNRIKWIDADREISEIVDEMLEYIKK